ncbi:putative proteasome subunit alpha type-7, partial [Spiromyces aspiralis]
MRIKNGVLLGSITRRASRLLKPGSNKRISHVEPHIGIVTTGWAADAREIVNIARREAVNYRESYKIPPPVNQMTRMLSFYVHAHTLYSSVRPFGVNALVAGKDDNGYQLYLMEPSGEFWGYRGCVVGKGQKEVKTQLERIDLDNLDPHIGIQKIVRMLLKAHKDSEKEEPYNIELSWICDETNGIHEKVPEEIVQQAIERFE